MFVNTSRATKAPKQASMHVALPVDGWCQKSSIVMCNVLTTEGSAT